MSGRGDDRTSMYGEAGTGICGTQFRYVEKFATPSDPVEYPAHYQQFGMEVIDIIRHVLGPEGFRAYCIGNELKYRLRAGDKGDAAQDLAKAMKYREFREGK